MMCDSLFGNDFSITETKSETRRRLKKINNTVTEPQSTEKLLKSKKVTLQDKLTTINSEVLRILGKQKDNIIVIKDKITFSNYISSAITAGRIAIDTETNNSTDTVLCKLMGLCLYYPNGKQAYIPINHRNPETKERLSWQLTELDCKEQLQRILDSKIDIIMHNGKFDYEVLKCTCNIAVAPTWDTLIAASLMDENVFSHKTTSLKYIYTTYIDKEQEKYSIDHLFGGKTTDDESNIVTVIYADIDPNIFALYAATDALMTDKVYLWEFETFYSLSKNNRVLNLLKTIEIPIIPVTAEIELCGVKIDQDLGERLKQKYNKQLENIDHDISQTLEQTTDLIKKWRLTPQANERTKQYEPTKTKLSKEKLLQRYPLIDKDGKHYKVGKAKAEQLPDKLNLSSSTQLAILFYDILGCPTINPKQPRGTGEDILESIQERLKACNNKTLEQEIMFKLCNKLLDRRGIVKLITTYIDVIPDLAKHWPDGKIRYRLNSIGTDTGRFASGGKYKFLGEDEKPVVLASINSQNLPSHNPEIRLLFCADTKNDTLVVNDEDSFEVPETAEVEVAGGWKFCRDLHIGDEIIINNASTKLKNILYDDQKSLYIITV